ncbi:MAG: hypothetical protein WBC33_05325, partial [Conexibacter sp.]
AHPDASVLAVEGALCEPFVERILSAARGRPIALVVADGTHVFLQRRSAAWYRGRGVAIVARTPIALHAITVNPLAPRSHRLDAHVLRRLVAEAIPGVPVLDVLDPSYAVSLAGAPAG